MKATLIIDDVDFEMLNEQRLVLAGIGRSRFTPEEREAIEGIQNMLDSWSDEEGL